ncbi:MAG: cellulase family glycosylhydrolase [Rikenellaceae bacterium]
MNKLLLSLCLIGLLFCACKNSETKFAKVENGQFIENGQPYYYIGTNLWFGAILGSKGEGGDRERLLSELDRLHDLGVNNLRVLVGADGEGGVRTKAEPTLQKAPGVYDADLLEGLDYLLVEMGKRNMKAVLYLNNAWEWSGGYTQYLMWAGEGQAPIPVVDGWDKYMSYASTFITNDKAKAIFEGYVTDIVTRTNSLSGERYVDDPTIFSWQISNEPRCFNPDNKEAFAQWIGATARLIRSLDPNHMISTGSEGSHGCEGDIELFEKIHSFDEISYINIHIWPKNWGWIDTDDMASTIETAKQNTTEYIANHIEVASRLGKPVALEEFGFPRDGMLFTLDTPTTFRDEYYQFVFDAVVASAAQGGVLSGCNFWGWGGNITPSSESLFWRKGDPYCGDPAQEEQGLNSVFTSDSSTLEIIKSATSKLN